MVACRRDYVHGGTFYDNNHTRIFMGLTMIENVDINTTHFEDTKKTPPSDIKRDGDKIEMGVGKSHGKQVSRNKKLKAA
jgi:hypothetical protein